MKRVIAATGLAVCLVFASPDRAPADSADVEVVRIQAEVRKLTTAVRSLGRAGTDEDDVVRVRKQVFNLLNNLYKILRVMGDNHQARGIIDGYPESMVGLLEALDILAKMRAYIGNQGPKEKWCENRAESFSIELHEALAKDGVTLRDLENVGRVMERQVSDLVYLSIHTIDELKDMQRDVARYRPAHREFNAVANALKEAAEDTLDSEEYEFDEMIDVCDPLVEFKSHKIFRDAVAVLENEQDAIENYVKDAAEWLADSRDIGGQICESLQLMRDAYCGADIEPNEDARLRAYDDLADDAADDFRRRASGYINTYARTLADRGETLSSRARDADEAHQETLERYEYLYDLIREVLKGSNHPKVRLWRSYGIQQHKRMQGQFNCNLFERKIPGMSGNHFPDCVDIRRCVVIEFKPGSTQGLKDGGKISDYVFGLNDWLESEWPKHAGTPAPQRLNPSNMRFDATFVEQARAWECFDAAGNAKFWGDVESYDPCTKDADLQCEP